VTNDLGGAEGELEIEAASSADGDAETSAAADDAAEASTGSEPEPEAETETEGDLESATEPEPESKPTPEPEPERESKPTPEPEPERESRSEPEPEPEPAEKPIRISGVYYAPVGTQPQPIQVAWSRRPRRRQKGLIAAVAAGAVAVIVAAAIAAVTLTGPSAGFHPTAGNPSGDAEQLANAFLKDWSAGDLAAAADLTDNPGAARQALTRYASGLHLRHLTGSAQSAVTATAPAAGAGAAKTGVAAATTLENVTYAVNATVSSGTASAGGSASLAKPVSGVWTSHPTLTAYQRAGGSGWFIQWKPDVLAPNLTGAEHLGVTTVAPTVISVTDSAGNSLSSYTDPTLTHIGTELEASGPAGQGVPGLDVQLENAKGAIAAGTGQAVVVSPQDIGALKTTINPGAERAAMGAVQQKPESAMVVLQPSSGDILAIANNFGQQDAALTAREAPGSDFKIVTSTALFNHHVITANSPVACPSSVLGIGNNAGETEGPGTPFSTDFAASCNNAFTQFYPQLGASSGGSSGEDLLASTAGKYYGLNEPWDIGIGNQPARYFAMPSNGGGGEIAEEAFGQGQLAGEPLAMASVTATVANGSFRQPILIPGTKQVTATPLPRSTQQQLWTCMRAVIASSQGTATGLGFGPHVYGKTGTATVGGQANPNAWFVAFDSSKDIAVATLVVNGGYGATAAAPEVKAVLDAYHG
jgi:hypothetical protein